jgi:hypothetical protein
MVATSFSEIVPWPVFFYTNWCVMESSDDKKNVRIVGDEPERESTVVLMPEFDISKANSLFKEFYKNPQNMSEDVRLYIYTPYHVGSRDKLGLFSDFGSSIVFAANRFHNTHFPYRESRLREFAHAKLSHLYCTLDKSIMYGFFNRHSAQSKVHNLNSVATVMGHPELLIDESILESGVEKDVVKNVLFQVKKNATKLLKDVDVKTDSYLTLEKHTSELQYPKFFKDKFGQNLDSIMLYGSSAKGEGNDFDNVIVLKNLPDNLYDLIVNTSPNENGKEVGAIFVPKYVLDKFLYINVGNTLFRQTAKVLEGKIDIPIESDNYEIFKDMYHAGIGSGKLISSMNLVYRDPNIFFDKPGLFEFFMKLNRFTYHGLMQNKGYVIKSKEEMLDSLKNDFDYVTPKFKADSNYIQESFLYANKASVEIAKKMYDPTLARQENEVLLEIDSQVSRRIFTANFEGKKVFLFKGHENIREKDVVPAVIINKESQGYNSRISDIKYYSELPEEFLIAKRI